MKKAPRTGSFWPIRQLRRLACRGGMEGMAGLDEEDLGKRQQTKSRLDQLRMADANLHVCFPRALSLGWLSGALKNISLDGAYLFGLKNLLKRWHTEGLFFSFEHDVLKSFVRGLGGIP